MRPARVKLQEEADSVGIAGLVSPNGGPYLGREAAARLDEDAVPPVIRHRVSHVATL